MLFQDKLSSELIIVSLFTMIIVFSLSTLLYYRVKNQYNKDVTKYQNNYLETLDKLKLQLSDLEKEYIILQHKKEEQSKNTTFQELEMERKIEEYKNNYLEQQKQKIIIEKSNIKILAQKIINFLEGKIC